MAGDCGVQWRAKTVGRKLVHATKSQLTSLSLEERLPLTLASLLRLRDAGSGLRVHALGAALDSGVERCLSCESNGDGGAVRPEALGVVERCKLIDEDFRDKDGFSGVPASPRPLRSVSGDEAPELSERGSSLGANVPLEAGAVRAATSVRS